MDFSTISEWLTYIANLHDTEIELGLDRVSMVAERLGVLSPTCPVIIVGGTNGKGSTVAGLEAIYRAAGYRVGVFTSPFLFKHNEQVRVNGIDASDEAFCMAFAKVESARGDISLTPFEFNTLAAFYMFISQPLDVWILEVGLGGRLDAVNIMHADVAVITSIGIDHVEWLGSTRDEIALEKAGIFRKNKPAICGDFHPPLALLDAAAACHVPMLCQGRDFHYQETEKEWSFTDQKTHYEHLPLNSLATQNMAIVLMTITLLQQRLPVKRNAIDQGLRDIKLLGRIQVIPGTVTTVYDVSHNPDAVAWLAKRLRQIKGEGKMLAVFSMLADKDIAESINQISDVIDTWYVAPLSVKRAASEEKLKSAFQQADIGQVLFYPTIQEAHRAATKATNAGDSIVIFGSFHTVADVQ